MKEIGGYFGLEQFNNSNGEYHKNAISLNTARNALIYLARAKHISKLYIPLFLCDSVSKVCLREGIQFEYYEVDRDFHPIFTTKMKENEFLYVVNYYGQLDKNYLSSFGEYYNLIVDNVQAFFVEPIFGIDTIYSCRKFFGVPDGSYLYTDTGLKENLPKDDSTKRLSHIYGRIKDGASAHYEEFQKNEDALENLALLQMSNSTHEMLSVLDYVKIKKIREENFSFLNIQLGSMNELSVVMTDGPYAYPFYCKNGMKIRSALAEKKIYIPTLWPNVLKLDDCLERDYAENILPLPCDQRYSIDDMQNLVDSLKKYF